MYSRSRLETVKERKRGHSAYQIKHNVPFCDSCNVPFCDSWNLKPVSLIMILCSDMFVTSSKTTLNKKKGNGHHVNASVTQRLADIFANRNRSEALTTDQCFLSRLKPIFTRREEQGITHKTLTSRVRTESAE